MFVIISQLYDIAWASAVAFFIIQILNLFSVSQKYDSGTKYAEGEIASGPNVTQIPHEGIWSIAEYQMASSTDNNTAIDSLERSIKINEELLMHFEEQVGQMVKFVEEVELILLQDRETMFDMCAKGKTSEIDSQHDNHRNSKCVLNVCIPGSNVIFGDQDNKNQLFNQQEVSLMEYSDIDAIDAIVEQETENMIRLGTSSSTLDLSSLLSYGSEHYEELSQEIEESGEQNILTKLLSNDGYGSTKKFFVISITYQSQFTINSRFLKDYFAQDIGNLAIEMKPRMVSGQSNCATIADNDNGGELTVVGSPREDVEGSKILFFKQSDMYEYESDDDGMQPGQLDNPLKSSRFNILSIKPLRQHLLRIVQQVFHLKVEKRTNSSHCAASWSEI